MRTIHMRDGELVTRAANWLQVSEYQIFKDAYSEQFATNGEKAERLCHTYFSEYIKDRKYRIPFWVRDYCRKVLRRN